MESAQKITLFGLISVPTFFLLIQIFHLNVDFITRNVFLLLIYLQLGFICVAFMLFVKFILTKQYRYSIIMFLVLVTSFFATIVFLVNDAFNGQ